MLSQTSTKVKSLWNWPKMLQNIVGGMDANTNKTLKNCLESIYYSSMSSMFLTNHWGVREYMFGYCLVLERQNNSVGGNVDTKNIQVFWRVGVNGLDSFYSAYLADFEIQLVYIRGLNFTFFQRQQINLHNTFCVCLNYATRWNMRTSGCKGWQATDVAFWTHLFRCHSSAIPAHFNAGLFSRSSVSFFTLF